MSQFFGCVTLNARVDINGMAVRMQESMAFFQSDKMGLYSESNVFICNKLVCNTPESLNAPIICQNERFVLAATCRLDNREELSGKLNIDASLSDHEYLLASYTVYGENCTAHLLGDFSFVVWDKLQQTLFMAKDHLGIKPLFYYCDSDVLLFATSISAIKAAKNKHFSLNKHYIAIELKNYQQDYEHTFFEDIKRLKPAHFCSFSAAKGVSVEKRYWELNAVDVSDFKSEEAIYAELKRLFTQAVVCRTRTHKNIACQLSGGMDSSAIAVLVSRHIDKQKLHTFSFVLSEKTRPYSERGIDEQGTQNDVIEYASLRRENHHLIEEFHYKDVFEQLDTSHAIMGGYANSDAIWQDSLFREAQKYDIGFSMSGFPGDECVSNNASMYYFEYIANKDLKGLRQLLKDFGLRTPKKLYRYFVAKWEGGYMKGFSKIQAKRSLLSLKSPFHKILVQKEQNFFEFKPSFKSYLKNGVCRPHTCLRTESEGAYALQYGIETVYPMADIRLLAFVYSLPTKMFKPKPYNRVIFRNLCKDILPDSVRLQPKFSGAMTLAFAEYWKKKQMEEFQSYTIQDQLGMFIRLESIDKDDNEKKRRLVDLYKLDYLINKNLP